MHGTNSLFYGWRQIFFLILDLQGEEDKVADLKLILFDSLSKSGIAATFDKNKPEDEATKEIYNLFLQISLTTYRGNLEEIEKIFVKAVAG